MKPKHQLLAFVTFAALIILVQACRKFDFFSNETKAPEFTVAEAKEWYYGVFKKTTGFRKTDFNSPFSADPGLINGLPQLKTSDDSFFKKFPYWNKAIQYDLGSMQVVEAPVFYEANILVLPGMQNLTPSERKTIAKSSLQKVVFFKQADQATSVRMVTLIPSLEYLKSKDYDISDNTLKNPDEKFDGFMVIRNWQEKVINIIEIKDAKYVRKVKIVKTGSIQEGSRKSENNSSQRLNEECGWVDVPVTVGLCIGNTYNADAPPSQDNCDNWTEYESSRMEYVPCEPEETDPFQDCIQMGNDNDYCNCQIYGVGCQGGDDPPGDGDNGEGNFDEQWNDNIIDSTNKPCIDSILNDLVSLQNSLPKLIRDFFAKNPQFTPIINTQLRNHTYDGNGNIIPAPGGWTTPNLLSSTFNIYINSLYSEATDLSTVTTIIHETFHAHLMNEVRTYINDSTYVRQLYDNYGYLFPAVFATWLQSNPGVPSGTDHHQAIAAMYRGLIADAINIFAIQRGINLPSGYANDLAWAGCSDSQAFQSLSSNEKDRITNRIAAEKDPNNTNGINSSNNSAKGNPCN